ncbi:hypothetical protein LGK95_07455 [Clostridium algoriphilum]|uniref:hypothetical protein n=1 Tax=Clostridium algoriphilum TaxID=198347 RepID=UPI001CF22FB9|nr:hypothetical protein [Clostridium algoriphilum]MCB2293355.1 hypothetical protein [Clostridium algoriphilum]
MELVKEDLDQINLTIESFSRMIGETWNVSPNILENYILANVSIAMIRNSEIKKDINRLYLLDEIKYYEAIKMSSCTNHVIMTQGTLQQEIEGRKALGILLIAEKDYNLRSTVIKLLRKSYSVVFNAVKKHDKKELTKRYLQMDEITRKTEARIEAAVYFYFGIYRSVEEVDQGFFKSIIDDIKIFEFYDPMTRDITKELEVHKLEIQEIKATLKREYGKINSFKDILNSDIHHIEELGGILENMFIINKFDINHLFSDSNFLNIDEILLAYIKRGNKISDPKVIIESVVNGIFIKSLINEYKKTRDLYFESNQQTLLIKVTSLEKNLNTVKEANKSISTKLNTFNQQNTNFEENLNNQINKLNKTHNSQVVEMQNKINNLEKQLSEEKKYRNELNVLREYVFKVNNDYIPSTSANTLADYIGNNKIIIIGGAKEWRRKFRGKYPELRSLHGFNENFDFSVLANYDYVFFYSGYMNHATYYKAMSFIRNNQIKFGYIGKTNMDLVEQEIIDELEKSSLN